MKKLQSISSAVVLALFLNAAAFAQEAPAAKKKCIEHFSLVFTAGSGSVWNDVSKAGEVTFGTLGINHQCCSKLSCGFSLLGSNEVDDEDEIQSVSPDATFAPVPEEDEEEGESELEDIIGAAMWNATYFPCEKHTVFIQGGTGYSFQSQNPAYTFSAGYNQKIYKDLGIAVSVRYFGNISHEHNPSLKAELGLSWNL